jgi:hypothetical protein
LTLKTQIANQIHGDLILIGALAHHSTIPLFPYSFARPPTIVFGSKIHIATCHVPNTLPRQPPKTAFSGPPVQNATTPRRPEVAVWIFRSQTPSPATHWDYLCGLGVSGVNFPLRPARSSIVTHVTPRGIVHRSLGSCPRNPSLLRPPVSPLTLPGPSPRTRLKEAVQGPERYTHLGTGQRAQNVQSWRELSGGGSWAETI